MSKKREVFDPETAVKEINSWLEEIDQLEESDDENILFDIHGDNDNFIYDDNNIDQENVQIEAENTDVNHHQKLLTKNGFVNSIASALDLSNYNELLVPNEDVNYCAILTDTDDKRKKETLTFTTKPPQNLGPPRQCDVVKEAFGVRGEAKNINSEVRAFSLFVSDEILNIIVQNTNKHIENTMSKLPQEILCNSKYSYLKTTDYLEIRALIGLFCYRGIYNLSGHTVKILFPETMGLPLFSAVMSENRFEFLVSNLCFDDSTTRKQRWSRDRFAAFREDFELFNNNCGHYVTPNIYAS